MTGFFLQPETPTMETTSTTESKIRFSRFMKLLLFLYSQKFSDRLAVLSYIPTPLPASIAAVDDGTLHRVGKVTLPTATAYVKTPPKPCRKSLHDQHHCESSESATGVPFGTVSFSIFSLLFQVNRSCFLHHEPVRVPCRSSMRYASENGYFR